MLVIGSGAGGAALAAGLSRAGLDVLVLEKGPRYERSDFSHDEIQLTTRSLFVPPLREDPHVVVDHMVDGGRPRLSSMGWTGSCVGGGTARMGGCLYRFHPDEFRLHSRLGPFEEVDDWPYSYDELEPYYSRAEWAVGVSGTPEASPLEGHRSRPLPMPPLDPHPLARHFDGACERLRLRPFSTPRAINSRPYEGRPACARCDFCAGFGCPTGARGGVNESLIPAAERTGRCEVRPGSMVREITLRPDGRAAGCIYVDGSGVEREVRAEVVCVCCSAVESARLLLMSKSPRFPAGLANGSGLVGRHLQFHAGSAARARFRYDSHPDKPLRDRNPFLGRSVADYYFLPAGVSEFAKGGLLRFDMMRPHPVGAARRLTRARTGERIWGEPLKQRLREHFCDYREVEFEVFQDYVPNSRTFVELDPGVTDRWGLPVARIHVEQPGHHGAAGAWLVDRGLEILDSMGADELVPGGIGYVNDVMAHGTCRAGSDPSTSVLDGFCRAHEVPNLFVVDGSFMPTSGAPPSTLTIIANAFRTADFIIDRARTGDLS